MATKLENSIMGMVELLKTSIIESDGKLTEGEISGIRLLKDTSRQSLKIAGAREDLEDFMSNMKRNEMLRELDKPLVFSKSGREPWNETTHEN